MIPATTSKRWSLFNKQHNNRESGDQGNRGKKKGRNLIIIVQR
jgi:hypothetical protein